ncbi:phosphatase PAP2 family protein [Verrucomicrobiota bacterium sgz303538]
MTAHTAVAKLRTWWTQRTPPELLVYFGMLVVAIGTWFFIALADEMAEGGTQRFDDWVLHSLRQSDNTHIPIGPHWLRDFFLNVTSLGSGSLAALFAVLVIGGFALQRRRLPIALIATSLIGGSFLSTILKTIFGRPRPPIEYRAVEVSALSFPSGHSFISAVLYLTLGALLAKAIPERRMKFYIIAVAVLLTFLVGFSRVYLGVHYATDVLGGWCAGLIWATLCLLVAQVLRNRYKARIAKALEKPNS